MKSISSSCQRLLTFINCKSFLVCLSGLSVAEFSLQFFNKTINKWNTWTSWKLENSKRTIRETTYLNFLIQSLSKCNWNEKQLFLLLTNSFWFCEVMSFLSNSHLTAVTCCCELWVVMNRYAINVLWIHSFGCKLRSEVGSCFALIR